MVARGVSRNIRGLLLRSFQLPENLFECGNNFVLARVALIELQTQVERLGRRSEREDKRLWPAGLGLFLCKAIVEAHGGEIWARSEIGKGTTFFVSLPVDGTG